LLIISPGKWRIIRSEAYHVSTGKRDKIIYETLLGNTRTFLFN